MYRNSSDLAIRIMFFVLAVFGVIAVTPMQCLAFVEMHLDATKVFPMVR